jgi:hypothetical protein
MTDEEIMKVKELFMSSFDGNKIIPIIDELLEMRNNPKPCPNCSNDGDDEFSSVCEKDGADCK